MGCGGRLSGFVQVMWLGSAELLRHGIHVVPRLGLNTGVRRLDLNPGRMSLPPPADVEWICQQAKVSLGIIQQCIQSIVR
jgi:hypothetical protein